MRPGPLRDRAAIYRRCQSAANAFINDCDTTVVVSNDGDLKGPLMLARDVLGRTVGINPHPRGQQSRALASCADFYKSVRPTTLRDSQFPATLSDRRGALHKPKGLPLLFTLLPTSPVSRGHWAQDN